MNDRWRTIGWCTLSIMIVAAIVQILYYYPLLPDKVASHFDADGRANDTMSKGVFAAIMIGTDLFMGILFLCIGPITKRLPASMINIPNRAYWLSEGQRDESIKSISGFGYWIGLITVLFLMIVFQLTVLANLRQMNLHATVFWAATIGYLIVTLGSCVWLMFRFKKHE